MPETYSSIELLGKLVAFPTVSDRSNLALIRFVEEYLAGHGVESTLVFDETGEKASLQARIGPPVDGGIILSGHTDVVPVEGQSWSSDPFVLEERNDRLYGRGAVDMKGFAACALAAVPGMIAAGLKRPIHIALSYDEEIGCLGAPPMIDRMLAEGPTPAAVFVGEPSSMKVVTAQKAIMVLRTEITGYSVHSSLLDRGVSAVTVAARLIAWLDDRTQSNAASADPANGFSPPYTTLHCGVVNGGTAHNIVAANAHFLTDIRTVTGEDPLAWEDRYKKYIDEVILPPMKKIHAGASVDVKRLAYVPGLEPEKDGAAENLGRRLTGDNSRHAVVYATEAGQFQERGISAVICGPGSIDQAHQPDEFISREQISEA
ncbi:MAG: acetylornithine deacetylase, partial [Phycisphaerales bacterium]|nr:acetylornithine deacetylase [Phycisphaerales bacterium]